VKLGFQRRGGLAGVVLLACVMLAGCNVSVVYSSAQEAVEQKVRALEAEKVVAWAIVDGRCKDALAVAREVRDGELVSKVRRDCTQAPWENDAMAAGHLHEPGPTKALAADREADWRRQPAADVVQFFYPSDAQRKKIGGMVIVRCRINEAGVPHDCQIASETPDDLGFGEAALKLAPLFELNPKIANGRAVESTVRIPITFKMPD